MSFENRLDTIPQYIRAESLTGLRSAMLKNNVRLGSFVIYRDIQFVKGGTDDQRSKGYWVAWYDEPFKNLGVSDEPTE